MPYQPVDTTAADVELYQPISASETTPVSWTPNGPMTYDQWAATGRTLQQIHVSCGWWIGDWLNEGENRFGETYAQAIDSTNVALETLKKYKSVSARIQRDWRKASLSWTHHFYVAYLAQDQRENMLAIAEQFEMSTREVKEVVQMTAIERETFISAARILIDENNASRAVLARVMNMARALPGPVSEDGDDGDEQGDIIVEEATRRVVDPDDVDTVVLEYFRRTAAPLETLYVDHAEWSGVWVHAEIDEQGMAVLKWGIK
jgi:hypothetical protein